MKIFIISIILTVICSYSFVSAADVPCAGFTGHFKVLGRTVDVTVDGTQLTVNWPNGIWLIPLDGYFRSADTSHTIPSPDNRMGICSRSDTLLISTAHIQNYPPAAPYITSKREEWVLDGKNNIVNKMDYVEDGKVVHTDKLIFNRQ